jgi:hypothetical protein
MNHKNCQKKSTTSIFSIHCWIENEKIVADVSAANSSGWLPVAVSNFSFKDSSTIGKWICFEMEVLLNTPGAQDGLYRIWADSALIVEKIGVDLRGTKNDLINEVMLDCYWNGGSPKIQKRYYDNFVISTKRIGPLTSNTSIPKKAKTTNQQQRNQSSQPVKILQLNQSSQPVRIYFNEKNGTKNTKIYLNGKKIKDRSSL